MLYINFLLAKNSPEGEVGGSGDSESKQTSGVWEPKERSQQALPYDYGSSEQLAGGVVLPGLPGGGSPRPVELTLMQRVPYAEVGSSEMLQPLNHFRPCE